MSNFSFFTFYIKNLRKTSRLSTFFTSSLENHHLSYLVFFIIDYFCIFLISHASSKNPSIIELGGIGSYLAKNSGRLTISKIEPSEA